MSVIDSVLPNTGLDADVLYRQPFKIKIKHCFYWKDDSSTPVGVLLKKDSLSEHSNDLFPNISLFN